MCFLIFYCQLLNAFESVSAANDCLLNPELNRFLSKKHFCVSKTITYSGFGRHTSKPQTEAKLASA